MANKSCPACQKQVGPRTKKCECGHVFIADVAAVPASNKSMTLDPLDKRVAESVESVKDILSRAERRPASAVPIKREEKENGRRTTIAEPPTRRYSGGGRVIVPAGACPVKPHGYKDGWPDGPASDEVVRDWAIAVYNYGDGRYAPDAVVYWARYFWDISNRQEWNRIRDLIMTTLCPQSSSHDSVDDIRWSQTNNLDWHLPGV